MRVALSIIFLFTYAAVRCQNYNDIDSLFKQKKYNELIAACNKYLQKDSTDAHVNDMKGRCYNAMHQYTTAMPYFEKALAMDKNATYITGWAYCDLGLAHIKTGDTVTGRNDLYRTVELGKTRNSVSTALNILGNLAKGEDLTMPHKNTDMNTMPNWVVIEAAHVKYFFEDTAGISYLVQQFITKHEHAFDTLNAIFETHLPVKMSFYVWLNEERANTILHCNGLGFSNPEKYTVNTRINQTIGHEMMHVLSYWAWGVVPVNESKFVNEGVAVAFDLATEDKIAKAKRIVAGYNLSSVLDIWEQGDTAGGDFVYAVGGAFMQFLYRNSSGDEFKQIIRDQTIPAAYRIYGKQKFNDLAQQFNKLIGLK